MDILNFKFTSNRAEVDDILASAGYTKIGHTKPDAAGYCILINRKKFFEISSFENANITQSSNLADVKQYCS